MLEGRQLLRRVPGARGLRRAVPRSARVRLAVHFLRDGKISAPKAWRLSAVWNYTLLEPARLLALYRLASDLVAAQTAGSFVECGSWAGGSAALLGAVAAEDPGRAVWLFDSWEGVPVPTEHDVMHDGESGAKGMFSASRHRAEEITFGKMKLERDRLRLVQGWFEQTLPEFADRVGDIALLHVDADWYESVKTCLEHLYDRVVDGGVVVIDDYGCWKGCQKAVDEFIRERGEQVELVRVDWTAVFFRKPRSVAVA